MRLDKRNIYILFAKPYTDYQLLKQRLFGFDVVSIGLYINGYVYCLRHGRFTVQKNKFSNEFIRERFKIIKSNTHAGQLPEGWEENLLTQKARAIDTLYLRHRCVKSASVILNCLEPRFNYHFGDMFVNKYYKRICLTK